MFVYVIDKEGKPVEPITSAEARIKIDNGKAFIINKAPFIIQLNYSSLKNDFSVDLYFNVLSNDVEVVVISKNGYLYFVENFKEDNLIENIRGAFYFLTKYIPINYIYFSINSSPLYLIDRNNKKIEFKNKSYSIIDKSKFSTCFLCKKEKPSRIYKVYDDFNFDGNSYYLCNKCYKNINKYDYMFNSIRSKVRVLKEIYDVVDNILKENNNAKS